MHIKLTFESIFTNRYLIKNFMIKDLKNRYTGSVMGFLWTIVHPLTILTVYSLVFSWMLKMRIGEELGTSNFSVWLYAGLLPWLLFAETLGRSTTTVLDHANLIKKTVFPSEILHVSLLLSNLVNFFIGFVILICGVLITGSSLHIVSLIYSIIYILPLLLLTLGFSWLCSALNVFFRDLGQLVSVILNIWFYATTIIYPVSVVPETIRGYFFWNPLVHVIEGMRASILKGALGSSEGLLYLYIFSVGIFVIGQFVFQKTKKGFVDVI